MNKKRIILYPLITASIATFIALVILTGNFLYRVFITKLELDIFNAIQSGNMIFIKNLISYGYPLNRIESSGSTMLINASHKGNLEIVSFLYRHGADVNKSDNFGFTPLSAASFSGKTDVMEYLIEKGASAGLEKVRMGKCKERIELSALHLAASAGQNEAIKLLLKKGVDVNTHGADNYTPLMAAAGSCHYEAVKLLLAYGADPEITTKEGTAYESAKRKGCKEVMGLLEKVPFKISKS